MNPIQYQIKLLNETVKCKLGASDIDGIGVFAICDIEKGEQMYCKGRLKPAFFDLKYNAFHLLRPEVRHLILQRWPLVKKGSPFLSPNDDARLISFMNHSSNPNYDPATDTALSDIHAGEEVTEDYSSIMQ